MAVTVTPDQARQEIESGYVDEVFVRWIAACGQMVEHYAPLAPETVQNVATIRLLGFLNSGAGQGFTSERDDTFAVMFSRHGASGMMKMSGAMDILAVHKQHRAIAA